MLNETARAAAHYAYSDTRSLDAAISAYLAAVVSGDVAGLTPLIWVTTWGLGSREDGDEWYQATTPFGSYHVNRCEGEWLWRYCFDEYYDEDEASCNDLQSGKNAAQAHWDERVADIVAPAVSHIQSQAAMIAQLEASLSRFVDICSDMRGEWIGARHLDAGLLRSAHSDARRLLNGECKG